MKKNVYSNLFEGKFTLTHVGPLSFLEQLYYLLSPATHTEKLLFKQVESFRKLASNQGEKLKILDVGCGGGHKKLTLYGDVFGIDISVSSIENASKVYSEALVCDITKQFPFKDEFFDVVFCSEVIGHIQLGDKDKMLREMVRVLSKDGLFVSSIETEGDNILTRTLKRTNKYKQYWIDYQGHIGLETPADTLARISMYVDVTFKAPASNHLLPIDGYMIFNKELPILNVFTNNHIRRFFNILLWLPFRLSLIVFPFSSANDLVLSGRKKQN